MFSYFLLLAAVGAGVAFWLMSKPQDFSDVGGAAESEGSRDLAVVLRESIDRDIKVTISERELNQWLAKRLVVKQGGALADKVKLERALVRFENDRAELILDRKIQGRPFTVSMYLQVQQTESDKGVATEILLHGGPYHEQLPYPFVGGRFGRLPVPQGFLLLVMPSFRSLAAAFPEELGLIENMARIRIEENHLVLDPSAPDDDGGFETF